jgi:hypothetical protein
MDASTASNHIPYLGVTVHWIDKSRWEIQNKVLAFRLLWGSHTGGHPAAVIRNVVQEWNSSDALRAIMADNATVNDNFFECLQYVEPRLKPEGTQVRSMAHVNNLAAQPILTTLKPPAPDDERTVAPELEQPSSRTITQTPPTGSQQVQPPGFPIVRSVRLTPKTMTDYTI